MTKLFINTIVGAADNISQLDLVKYLDKNKIEIDGIEVRGELFSNEEATRSTEMKAIGEIAQKNNWELCISYPNDLFSGTGIHETAKRLLKEAEENKIISVKFNTGQLSGIEKVNLAQYEALFEGNALDVRIENGQEIENGTIPYVQKAFDSLAKQKLPIGFTYDMGNWVIMDSDPKEAFDQFKDKITAFHLKNVNPAGETTLVDDGVVEWRELVGLDIPYIIEYAIPLDEIQSEINKIKEAMA